MDYRRFGSKIVARIDKGEEILEKLKEIALKENIKLAGVSATCEMIIDIIDGRVDRRYSEEIGLNLFEF